MTDHQRMIAPQEYWEGWFVQGVVIDPFDRLSTALAVNGDEVPTFDTIRHVGPSTGGVAGVGRIYNGFAQEMRFLFAASADQDGLELHIQTRFWNTLNPGAPAAVATLEEIPFALLPNTVRSTLCVARNICAPNITIDLLETTGFMPITLDGLWFRVAAQGGT